MKYQIGDKVWRASWESTKAWVECPDCAGTGRGIGAPLIQLPMGKVSVATIDGEPALFMTMTDLIELTGSILNIPLKKTA